MNFDEIKTLIQFNDKESKVFMPNEIFTDLIGAIKNSPHIGFAYSYIYLVTWLYRYAKHMSNEGFLDNGKIKKILGYNANTKGLDYLTKRNGLLDQLGYTETAKDFPIAWTFEDNLLEFDMISDNKEILDIWNLSRKYSIKFPVKGFYRYLNDEELKVEYESGYEDGTFFDVSNTHCIPFEVFMYCMDNEDIGTIGFYLYSFIKWKNNYFTGAWDVSIENLQSETGIAENTLLRYLDQLKKFNMIEAKINQEYFSLAIPLELRKANSYMSKEFKSFLHNPKSYEKIKVMKVKEYKKLQGEEFTKLFGNEVDIPLDQLPY